MSEVDGEVYEHIDTSPLDGSSRFCFQIPESVIFDTGSNDKRVTAFSYFAVRRGLDRKVRYCVNDIVRSTGRKPNGNPNGINEKFSSAISVLCEQGYIELDCEPSNSAVTVATFNVDGISDLCRYEGERFANVYVDEFETITLYDGLNSNNRYVNVDVLMLVFAYLRMSICRRSNRLYDEEPGDCRDDRISKRKLKYPETHYAYYKDIAERLGLTVKSVSDAVSVLVELGLIYAVAMPRANVNGKWCTSYTVFSNTYKRECGKLLAKGREYYMEEIENTMRKLGVKV